MHTVSRSSALAKSPTNLNPAIDKSLALANTARPPVKIFTMKPAPTRGWNRVEENSLLSFNIMRPVWINR